MLVSWQVGILVYWFIGRLVDPWKGELVKIEGTEREGIIHSNDRTLTMRCNMENAKYDSLIMTHAQLQTELLRCEYCEEKPCREACRAHCSPADFIMAARGGHASDLRGS